MSKYRKALKKKHSKRNLKNLRKQHIEGRVRGRKQPKKGKLISAIKF